MPGCTVRQKAEGAGRRILQMLDFALSKVDIALPEGKVRELRSALGNPL